MCLISLFFLIAVATNILLRATRNPFPTFFRMVHVEFNFLNGGRKSAAPASDPATEPVIVIGRLNNLKRVEFEDVKSRLEPRVVADTWTEALATLNPSPTDAVSLYLNSAFVCALPNKCSRHNTPSRAHALTKLVKSCSSGRTERVIVVCERRDVFASGCAVARAYPVYSRKTTEASRAGNDVEADNRHKISVEFIVPNEDNGFSEIASEDLDALKEAAFGIQTAARIVDAPCSEMHTDAFVETAREIAKRVNAKVMVVRGEELDERGFGGIYGVGKAAIHPPALCVLSHEPAGATKTVAWVGKGIVYDTGGLSIKGKTAMPGMKRDCGGAAGILGAFHSIVSAGFSQNLHAVFCLAENAVGDRATKPDDIHTLYSGKTVEINNTDAEGRLVVGDGVAFARRDLNADVIVDMCTLTGAQGVSTGKYHAAHLTNDGDWEKFCAEAGRHSGDLSFPLVYCPELQFPEFNSAVADMKNSVADRSNAQSSCAGLFINAHLGFDYPGPWLHIDMASPVHSGERATGYGVALLSVLFGRFTRSKLLREMSPLRVEEEVFGVDNNDADSSMNNGSKSKRLRKH